MPAEARYTCKLAHPVEDLRQEVLRHFAYWRYPMNAPSIVTLWLPESARQAWERESFGWAERRLVLLGAHPRSAVEVLFFEEFWGEVESVNGSEIRLLLSNDRAYLDATVGPQHLQNQPAGPLTGRKIRALRLRRLDGLETFQVHLLEAELCLS